MYLPADIDKVRESDIVKTIMESGVKLKKSGANYKGLSPFSDEKTPSFMVSPEKQIFKCFSSGKAGDGIKFLMELESFGFIEAIERIAKIHNIVLEKKQETLEAKRTRLAMQTQKDFCSTVASKYSSNYHHLPSDHWAKKNLFERGFSNETIIEFSLGYSLEENQITNLSQEGGNFENAKTLGLTRTKEGKSYDFFRKRIMFPIINHKGVVVGFGGRRSNDEKDSKYAKYLNSPESNIFAKSSILYGLWQARKSISKKKIAILSEGYTDIIALHQNGVDNSVATLGTALTEDHLKLLKNICHHIIILRDGDNAGIKASIRDLKLCLKHGFKVSVCEIPDGEDPDSMCRKEPNINEWIESNKRDGISWYVEYLFREDKLTRANYKVDCDDLKFALDNNIAAAQSPIIEISQVEDKNKIPEQKRINAQALKEVKELKAEYEKELKNIQKIDIHKKTDAFEEIVGVLHLIPNEIIKKEYVKMVSKRIDFKITVINQALGKLEKEDSDKKFDANGKLISTKKNLPEGGDQEEYNEYGFITLNNSYWFEDQKNNFFQGTNFIFIPLYHIMGRKENKRVVELVNVRNKKRLIDFDSSMFANWNEFKKQLYKLGGFRFLVENGTRNDDFERFVGRFDEQFEPARELLTMGWDPKGFWAFADGIFYKESFIKVNKYGVVKLVGIEEEDIEDEHNEAIENYYSPAYSVMHKRNQQGDDPYENDRHFIYKKSPVSFSEYQKQMIKVFGDKAIIGIMFNISAIFRDLFIKTTGNFPLLGGFGEKDSGKSAFGQLLQDFFYTGLKPLDISQATVVGFTRRVSRCHNTVLFLDEYDDKRIDDRIHTGMMGGYNGLGREKGMNSNDKRTINDRVNSAFYYAGQFLPTRMDNALATRTIALNFPFNKFTAQEKEEFGKLIDMVHGGVSSLVLEIVKHREYFETELSRVQSETVREMKEALKDEEYQERIFGNVIKLITSFRILKYHINFEFTKEYLIKLCLKTIKENSEQITDSNGISEFWKILEWLQDNNRITKGYDYKIESTNVIKKITIDKKVQDLPIPPNTKVLFLRIASVHQDYSIAASTRENVDVIGESTIKNYLKSRSYYIGYMEQKSFRKGQERKNTSCHVFNYSMMLNRQVVNLETELAPVPVVNDQTPPTIMDDEDDDDLPF